MEAHPNVMAAPRQGAYYRPLRVRSLLTIRWQWFGIALSVVVLALDVIERGMLLGDGGRPGALSAVDSWNTALSIVELVVFFLGAIIFLFWFRRAYGNVRALMPPDPDPGLGTGWSIGGWFVPFGNLVLPKMIANDIWRAGDPDLTAAQLDDRPVSSLVHWWWGAWIVASILGNAAFRTADPEDPGHELATALSIDGFAEVASVAAAILLTIVVRRATSRQESRHERLQAAPPPPEPERPAGGPERPAGA